MVSMAFATNVHLQKDEYACLHLSWRLCFQLVAYWNAPALVVRAKLLLCRDQGEVASQTEDRLLEVLKAVGARVDSAVGTFTNLSSFGRVEQSEVGHCPHLHPLCVTAIPFSS